jgi:acetylornithine deacetylase/succinyl-diaminopimelate desuccinylase-like protein
MSADDLAGLREYVDGSEPWFRTRIKTLVEHATVSPGKTDDRAIRAGAEAARDLMAEAGGDAELVECAGTPSVFAQFSHDKPRARVVVYNHLDVQPASPAQWTQADPFALEVHPHPEREFLYRGRGSTDDKGPGLCALRAASYVAELGLPIDIGILWETEEEIGSPNFGDIVDAKRDALSCDAVIVSDTIWPSDTQPAISIGLRGSLQAVLRLTTSGKHAHSGLVGGAARNPLRELCRVATAIHDATFWRDDVEPPSAAELAGFMRSGFDLEYFKRAHDLHLLESEVPLEVMLAIWARPTFEVHGLVGGHMGPGVKTIVPATGELKTSFRLLPGQDPVIIGQRLQAFVAAINPDVEVSIAGYLAPYRGRADGRVHDAIAAGLAAATGKDPVTVREGGSIGAVPILAEKLGVAVHFLPLSLPDHGYHAPNEYFDWRQAKVGIEAWVRAFAALAA